MTHAARKQSFRGDFIKLSRYTIDKLNARVFRSLQEIN